MESVGRYRGTWDVKYKGDSSEVTLEGPDEGPLTFDYRIGDQTLSFALTAIKTNAHNIVAGHFSSESITQRKIEFKVESNGQLSGCLTGFHNEPPFILVPKTEDKQ